MLPSNHALLDQADRIANLQKIEKLQRALAQYRNELYVTEIYGCSPERLALIKTYEHEIKRIVREHLAQTAELQVQQPTIKTS